MAIGTPVGIGSFRSGVATTATVTLTTTAAVTAGDSIIVVVGSSGNNRVLNAVTDSAGNTYTIDATQGSVNSNVYIASCHHASALPTSGTITATFASDLGGGTTRAIDAMTVSGLASFDVGAGSTGSGTAWSSGATATTAQADELAVGSAMLNASSSSTPAGGYTELYDGAMAGIRTLTSTYKVLAATGAQTASGTWASSQAWVAAVATYKGAVAAQTVVPTGIASGEAFGSPAVTQGPAPQTIAPAAIASAEAFGTATVVPGPVSIAPTGITSGEAFGSPIVVVAGGTQFIAPAGITSAEAFGQPTIVQQQFVVAVGIPSAEAFGSPTVTVGAAPAQIIAPAGIPSAEAFGSPVLVTIAPLAVDGSSGFFVELTTLHYPDAEAVVLAVVSQFDDPEVAIPLNDARTAKVTLSIYDDALRRVRDHFGSIEGLEYTTMLRVRAAGRPEFWGAITVPEWRYGEGKVTLNAVDRALSLQHHFLKDGDPTDDGPLSVSGKYPLSTTGVRLLRDAALNEASDDSHGVPDLGIVDGDAADIPLELDPVPRLTLKRHAEVWRSMIEIASHELAPDIELEPVINVPGAYAKLNCYLPQGVDRTGAVLLNDAVVLHYGFGRDNLDDFTATPGGKLVNRQTYTSSDDKVRKRVTDWDSASFRGVYGAVDTTDYDSGTDNVGEALTLKAKLEVRKYREPPRFLSVRMKPEQAIRDTLARYRYGRDFAVGDTIRVEAKKGYGRESIDARITKVTLRAGAGGSVVPELELVPDVGDGTTEIGDG